MGSQGTALPTIVVVTIRKILRQVDCLTSQSIQRFTDFRVRVYFPDAHDRSLWRLLVTFEYHHTFFNASRIRHGLFSAHIIPPL